MLGTHNSLTFAKPSRWWMRPFNFLAKCQDKDIEAQLKAGARYFDIRVDTHYYTRHGLMKYDYKIWQAFHLLELFAETHPSEVVCYRIILEYPCKPRYASYLTRHFENVVKDLQATYTHLKFCGAIRKWDWLHVAEPAYKVSLVDEYSSCKGWKGFPYIPSLYAKWRNRKSLKDNQSVLDDNNKVLLMDFI